MTPRSICVFCGSSSGFDPAHEDTARRLGTELADGGHRLVYGGGHVGLMGVVADAVLAAGGEVVGVITEQLLSLEIAHHGLTSLDVQPSMHHRKARMAELADGVIALPGGFGTWEEALEILTWNQLGILSTPLVFLDTDGFYQPLFTMIDGAVSSGFVSPANKAFAQRAGDPAEALRLACGPTPAWSPKWVTGPQEQA